MAPVSRLVDPHTRIDGTLTFDPSPCSQPLSLPLSPPVRYPSHHLSLSFLPQTIRACLSTRSNVKPGQACSKRNRTLPDIRSLALAPNAGLALRLWHSIARAVPEPVQNATKHLEYRHNAHR